MLTKGLTRIFVDDPKSSIEEHENVLPEYFGRGYKQGNTRLRNMRCQQGQVTFKIVIVHNATHSVVACSHGL